MRYVDLWVEPDTWFHDIDSHIFDDPAVSHGPIHHLRLLRDDTAVILYELEGKPERIETLFERQFDHAITYQTSHIEGGTMVYAHIDPSDLVRRLLSLPLEAGLLIDFPLRFTPEGRLHLTVVGEEAAVRDALSAVPEGVAFGIEATGQYRPAAKRVVAQLTSRQREILETALELGYYEEPRRATYRDIAAVHDCTTATVGEHLRRAESQIVRHVTDSAGPSP